MRIITGNICRDCCYCIEDYGNKGLCCIDTIYKPIRINQSACRFFAGDKEDDEDYSCLIRT